MGNMKMSRRSFLKGTALMGAAGMVGGTSTVLASCSNESKNTVKPLKEPGTYYIPELPDKAEQISASVIRKIVSMNLSAPGGNYLEEYAYAVNSKIKNHEIRTENILFAVR